MTLPRRQPHRRRFHIGSLARGDDKDLVEILRKSAFAFSLKVIAAISMLGLNLVVSRLLGAAQAGTFLLALTLVTVSSVIARFGLDLLVVRLTAAHTARLEHCQVCQLLRTVSALVVVLSLSLGGFLAIHAGWISTAVFSNDALAFPLFVMACCLPLVALYGIQAHLLQGLKRIGESLFVLSVLMPLSFVVLSVVTQPKDANAAALVFFVAVLVTVSYSTARAWSRYFCAGDTASSFPYSAHPLLESALPLWIVAVATQAVAWGGLVILGATSTSENVAIFAAVERVAILIGFSLIAVNSIAAPKFSAMFHLGEMAKLKSTVRRSNVLVLASALPLFLVIVIAPERILQQFGDSFDSGATALRILAVGQLINVATGSVGFLLAMTGHERDLRNNVLIAAFVSLGLAIPLAGEFGINGVAVSTALGVAILNLLSVWRVRVRFGFWPLGVG